MLKPGIFLARILCSERENFSFDKMGLYFKNGWVDEVLFFTALLMITEKDFYIQQSLENIYVKTKFEAEAIILNAIKLGI